MLKLFTEARKALITLAGVAASLLALGYVPAPYDHYVSGALGALTFLGVYQVPNQAPAAKSGPLAISDGDADAILTGQTPTG